VKRVSLVVSFWVVSISLLAMIDADANPYDIADGILPFGVSQYGEAPLYGGALQYGEVPQPGIMSSQIMVASHYGYSHEGNMTASGVPFDPHGFTAAHKTMPLGTPLLVSYGGKSVEVIVNDRGPYVDGVDIDLSQAAADAIGLTPLGVAPVEVTVL
jgi:rare lipoprotein A (RlpA)-like double-psi beta-barrel protein